MPLPRGCKIREIETGAKNCFQFQLDCPNVMLRHDNPLRSLGAGMIKACRRVRRRQVVYGVDRLFVQPELRRRGFATALYERAAQEACRRRARLASTARQRDSHSIDFWRKQYIKGRAEYWPARIPPSAITEEHPRERWANAYDLFVLKDCNDVHDLSGVRSAPAWVR